MTAAPFEIRLHGRGGQGVVTAAELLSVAAFLDGHEAQAFPSFGSERMGAPVMAFCRIADQPIRSHEPVTTPRAVVIFDATLLQHDNVLGGLVDGGYALINSVHSPGELGLAELTERLGPDRVLCVPATDFAREATGRPLPNVCLLGAFAALTGQVTQPSLETAVRERFRAPVAEANIAALAAAFDHVQEVCHA
jgi:pyruvate ferredoxin oxidoreductase gamma subunit